MPSQQERRRNNVKTGVFVTVAVGGALATTIIMADLAKTFGKPMHEYQVSFPVSSGVSNIQPGAAVQVGGLELGKVKDVVPVLPENETASFEDILVRFEVNREITLFNDADVHVNAPLLGSGAWLEITDVGTPGQLADADTIIDGQINPGGLLGPLLGPQNAEAVMDDTAAFTSFLGEIPDRYGPRMDQVLDNAKSATADVKDVVADFKQRQPEWSEQVSAVLENANELMSAGDAFLLEGQEGVREVRTVISDHRADVDAIVGNVKSAAENAQAVTARFREETMDQFARLMNSGQDGVDKAVAAIDRFQIDYEMLSVDLDETMSNATLASQQLKLTMAEVRRSPWKVLYRPSADEVEHELLYDAARSYAVATIDLKAAVESLERLMERYGDRIRSDPVLAERVSRVVEIPLEQHTIAQQQLLDILVEQGQ